MKRVRRTLIRTLRPVLHFFGWASRRRQSRLEALIEGVRRVAQTGDVVLTYRRRSVTGFLIPGHWDHAALVDTSGGVIDAVYPEVRSASLLRLLEGVDEAVVLAPRFASVSQRGDALSVARRYLGSSYDLGFEPGKDAFYCSELVWHAYKQAVPGWDFDARERLGVATVTPQDLHDADAHWLVKAYIPTVG